MPSTKEPKLVLRSSSHSLKFANTSKIDDILVFLTEYRRLLQEIIDVVWDSGIPGFEFSVPGQKLLVPSFLPNPFLKTFPSWFTARMKQCVGKQACSMLRSATRKPAKRLYKLEQLRKEGKDTRRLKQAIVKNPPVKPNAANAKAELDARFLDFTSGAHFDEFVHVMTIGNKLELFLPIKYTKVSKKWSKAAKRKTAVRLYETSLDLIYEFEYKPKNDGSVVGSDLGSLNVATFSDRQVSCPCHHGHTLDSIQHTLACRIRGSKGFERGQAHRTNYVNWSLNQFNFKHIKELRVESHKGIRFKKPCSRFLSHWTERDIAWKLKMLSETEGFFITKVNPAFRSQRCVICGWVRKANRKGKVFCCTACGHRDDADQNASYNIALDLPEVPIWVRLSKMNRTGFYWTMDGLFDSGHEPIVRVA